MNETPRFENDLRSAMLPSTKFPAEIRRRLSSSIYQTVPLNLESEFEGNGWVVDRRQKKSVKMRRPKAYGLAFEDRVWGVFAKLQFPYMNRDRNFSIPYGPNATDRKNAAVIAADDEVVLVIDCVSNESLRSHDLEDQIEDIQTTRQGVIRSIRNEFPHCKIKFILATNNCIFSTRTSERLENMDVVHIDEEVIDYYLDLAEHLGKAARFQLLGSLLAGTKIPGLESTVPAIQCSMGRYKYYSFAIEPARLLKLGYVLHRNKANTDLMPTYQRLIKKSRLKKVSGFVESGGSFPNSIIVNIESGKRGLRFDPVGKVDGSAKLGILHLPQTYRAAYIIDGQHRLYGYADSARSETDLIPVVAFVDLPQAEQVRIFMQINENQQAVPKNLRNTLNADLLWDSKDLREQSRALKLRIAGRLGEDKKSPLFGRLIVGEDSRSATRCITIDAISRGLDRGNFLGTFTKTEMRQMGTLFRVGSDATFDLTLEFISQCLWHVRKGLDAQWRLGMAEGGFVFMNNGVESLLRIFSDVVDHVAEVNDLELLTISAHDLFDECAVYLDALVEHLEAVGPDEAADYRRQYGSGGATKYWRRLQEAIRDQRPSFNPPGLDEYLVDEAQHYQAESQEFVRDLERFIKGDIRNRLENEYGSDWYRLGVPRTVRLKASELAAKRNVDAVSDDDEIEPWDCLYIVDYESILTHNHELWTKRFAKRYTFPGEEQKKGGWKARTNWMGRLNDVRNSVVHGRGIAPDEYEFLVVLDTWLIKGQTDNEL